MIIVRLIGGLGNQMFQYAMAKTLADKHGTEVFIDKSLCAQQETVNSEGLSLRTFGLDVFNVTGRLLEGKINRKLMKIRKEKILTRKALLCLYKALGIFIPSLSVCLYERKDVGFDKGLLKLPDNTVLYGYFPSWRYFEGNEKNIRREYTFVEPMDEPNKKIAEEMASCNSVSLHVRRGDYISNEKTKDKFGVCSPEYYKNAVEYISGRIKEPKFFVFTNDSVYVRENLKLNYSAVYVEHNVGSKNHEDMRLMSMCRHNIISNSSFSWWGAWLNTNPDKIVTAPSPAFESTGIHDSDFYPSSWVLLKKSG